jgi:hypothetical protein
VDTSTLISLAWAGRLDLLSRVPLQLVVLEAVHQESVVDGLSHGHADAAAIETVTAALPRLADPPGRTVDDMVVAAAAQEGAVLCNDVVIGRRVHNLGARWLRTADLVVLLIHTGRLAADEGSAAIGALHDAGRITDALRQDYLEELA